MKSFGFVNINEGLPVLLGDLVTHGDEVGSRLGERTRELSHVAITLRKPWQRELTLPGRKANIAAQIAETMWVLAGRNDIGWLSSYLPRAVDFSDDGETWRAGYGPRLRNMQGIDASGEPTVTDQLEYVVNTLRSSPGSRQAVATIWDPAVDREPGKDRACNNWLHFLARDGKLHLLVGIRSNDVMWGWSGINAFEWSALQEIVASMINHGVGDLSFTVGSFHLYDRHWAKATELSSNSGPSDQMLEDSPRFNATGLGDVDSLDELFDRWFQVEHEIRNGYHSIVDAASFPEPMLQSWLRVLQWWWSGDVKYLQPLRGTRLYEACRVAIQPKQHPVTVSPDALPHGTSFVEFVDKLHTAKHLAYGDSWKRRGEYMIMANIARKIDRLEGGADTPDETQVDTAIDLLVYLCKYNCWLIGLPGDPHDVKAWLEKLEAWHETQPHSTWEPKQLVELFGFYETLTAEDQKRNSIGVMMEGAYCLAHTRWSA